MANPKGKTAVNLADWMSEARSLADRLRAVESLCAALLGPDGRTGRGGFLDPTTIQALADGTCQVRRGAASGSEPGYRAPETIGRGTVSPRADVFVVGVLGYELLTGEHPFAGEDPTPGMQPRPVKAAQPGLPADLSAAVMACLELDPERRAKDVSALLARCRSLRESGAARPLTQRIFANRPLERALVTAPEEAKPAAVASETIRRPSPPALAPLPIAPLPVTPPPPPVAAARPPSAPRAEAGVLPAPTPPAPRAARSRRGLVVALLSLSTIAGAAAGLFLWQRFAAAPAAVGTAEGTTAPQTVEAPAPPPPTVAPALSAAATPPAAAPSPPVGARPSPMPSPRQSPAAARRAEAAPRPAQTVAAPPESMPTAAPPAPAPAALTPPPTKAAEAPAPPRAPARLTTLSPASIPWGRTLLVDLRGAGIRRDHRVQITRGGRPAPGVTMTPYKWVSDTLLIAMIRVEADAIPGAYDVSLVEPDGTVSGSRVLRIDR